MKRFTASTAIIALATAGCVTPLAAPPVTVAVGDAQVVEGNTAFVGVTKTGNGSAKFSWSIIAGTAGAADYVDQSGTITSSGNVLLALGTVDDSEVEGPEGFTVRIVPKGDKTVVSDPEGVVTLADNDLAPAVPVTCWDGSVVTPPAQCPASPPIPPSGDIPSNGLTGLTPVNSVDPMLASKPAGIPPSAAPDVVGAFRFTCGFAGLGRFDPKVAPGDITGKVHGHQFYGNTGINPFSSYETLRASGPSTCAYGPYPANRSGYWQPWLEDGRGNVLQPDVVTVYYKRRPPTDPKCSDPAAAGYQGQCVEMPNGLFYIAGFDFLTNKPTSAFTFTCQLNGGTVYSYATMAEAATSGRCVAGGEFGSRIDGPSCWDGKRVDSVNHRDHMAFGSYGSWGYYKCPATHPYVVPTLSILSTWRILEGDDLTLWRFSSDHLRPELPAGSTFHIDFFMAWEPGSHAMWETPGCLGKMLSCSAGVLGNGRQITNAANPIYPDPITGQPVGRWTNPYRVVPIPGPEANLKLYAPSYGRAAPDWASKVGKPHPLKPPKGSNAATIER